MQPTQNPERYRTAEVEPAIWHAVVWRVTSVTPLQNFRLRVIFVDGTAGEVNMSNFLSQSTVDGTLFAQLRDPSVFSQARVELGAVQWPNGAELAPDAMYDAVREHGQWIVE